MIKALSHLPTLAMTLILLGAPASYADPGKHKSGKRKDHRAEHNEKNWHKNHNEHGNHDYDNDHVHQRDDNWWQDIRSRMNEGRFDVPPVYRPPQGMCRRWYPNLHPSQQPRPEQCGRLRREPNSYILYGDRGYDSGYQWENTRDPEVSGEIPRALLDMFMNRVR